MPAVARADSLEDRAAGADSLASCVSEQFETCLLFLIDHGLLCGLQLQELIASKDVLESSLKEVDSSLPGLQQQLEATLSSTHETRCNNEALQLEAAMLQRVSSALCYCSAVARCLHDSLVRACLKLVSKFQQQGLQTLQSRNDLSATSLVTKLGLSAFQLGQSCFIA